MAFATPSQIESKAQKIYDRFLVVWLAGDANSFFPSRVRVSLTLDKSNPATAIAANEKLLAKSKARRGWGYTVHQTERKSQAFGRNQVATAVTIDSLEDLLRLIGRADDFAATQAVVAAVRERFPSLEPWLQRSIKSLHKFQPSLEGLLAVAGYFVQHPWPDCYARQIPVPVDTKFVARHRSVLRQWLDVLLPASAIDVNETKFERRFGLRDGRQHRGVRFLDEPIQLQTGASHQELSLPVAEIAALSVADATVFIVENRLNLLTLPSVHRGVAIEGAGNAVNRLESIQWLRTNRVVYWGDIDVEGFLILGRLRGIFPNVQSIMMDLDTLQAHGEWVGSGSGARPVAPTNLTSAERDAFDRCAAKNLRLEQERVLQKYVNEVVSRFSATDH
jgi:hypothetical protein